MKVGIFGSGMVGKALASKLAELGHEVLVSSRHPENLKDWLAQGGARLRVGSLAETAAHGEILFNAVKGKNSLEALASAGVDDLKGKILVDISNPLVFSPGMPPSLFVSNTDSLGEQIQRAYPQVRVVKTLNTVTANLMVNPRGLANGDHAIFVSGNDAQAKAKVVELLTDWFGWKHVIDLGDITTARAAEMYLALWLRLRSALGTNMFNIKIVRAAGEF
jgi:hypothetical protein